jgi:DNA-binding SARP family transcriptional activator
MSRPGVQAATGRRDLSDKAVELLGFGRYEEVADLLRQVELGRRERDPWVRGRLLDIAFSICRACSEDRAEVAWHKEALSRIAGREDELKRGLKTVLDLLGGPGAKTPGDREAPSSMSTIARGTRRRDTFLATNRVHLRRPAEPSARRKWASRGPSARPTAPARTPGVFRETEKEAHGSPVMAVYCFGSFQVYFQDRLVEDWANGKGKAIFKFLVMHPDRPVGKEILMDLFWADFEPHAARNNLNVAIYSLRRALAKVSRSCSVVLFRSDFYLLNPDLDIWIDYKAFGDYLEAGRALEQRGELTLAMDEYRCAEALYRGEFLEEDRYEDWPDPLRRSLRDDYLALLDRLSEHAFEREDYGDCVALCGKTLAVEACYEESHRRLMRCWSRQGLRHLAVRQYYLCRDALARELELPPSQATTELFEEIRLQPV